MDAITITESLTPSQPFHAERVGDDAFELKKTKLRVAVTYLSLCLQEKQIQRQGRYTVAKVDARAGEPRPGRCLLYH
ncbi:hypothetical protein E2542_SST22300 [Spatholobus suberectus]|nr:hypothetical protein E2542_SST22300 [Spatholobus suberectus]